MNDIIADLGELALGTRLRRLADYILTQGQTIYDQHRIDFDPNGFAAFYGIWQHGPIQVTELSERLGVSHPALIHTLKSLATKGYIRDEKDPSDKRKRLVCLSEKGRALLPELQDLWQDIAQVLHESVQFDDQNMMQSIQRMEARFAETSIADRVKAIRKERLMSEIKILPWDPSLAHHWSTINYAWIEKHFTVEKEDQLVLDEPQEQVIDKGGDILFSSYAGEIAGTVGLKRINDDVYEMIKMGVSPRFKGKYIGLKLGEAIIDSARNLGAKRIVLDSNQKLLPALNLYKKLGFTLLPCSAAESDYVRCDISMELILRD